MKQTSVEFFYEKVIDLIGTNKMLDIEFERSKEMEKQQIIYAYETGDKYKFEAPGEQYYNETFNK